jgi:hypothetical protein
VVAAWGSRRSGCRSRRRRRYCPGCMRRFLPHSGSCKTPREWARATEMARGLVAHPHTRSPEMQSPWRRHHRHRLNRCQFHGIARILLGQLPFGRAWPTWHRRRRRDLLRRATSAGLTGRLRQPPTTALEPEMALTSRVGLFSGPSTSFGRIAKIHPIFRKAWHRARHVPRDANSPLVVRSCGWT